MKLVVSESNSRKPENESSAPNESEASSLSSSGPSEFRESPKAPENEIRSPQDLRLYMLSRKKIERAKQAHSSSKFDIASRYYEEASAYLLHTASWKNEAHLFLAESLLEKAEIFSLKGKTRPAIELLEKSRSHLTRFMAEPRKEEGRNSLAFHNLASELIAFCEARISLETSMQFYWEGDIDLSNEVLRKARARFEELASSNLSSDINNVEELRSMALHCDALENFQRAQTQDDPQLYLVAKETFEKAAELTMSRSFRQLLLGLAHFSTFLFDSNETVESLESTFDVDAFARCNEELDRASGIFRKIGNKPLLDMLRGSKHILDATIKMSAAEREIQRVDVKAALYSRAKKSLSLASKYYGLAGLAKGYESLKMIAEEKNQETLAGDISAETSSPEAAYSETAKSYVAKQSFRESYEQTAVLIEHEFERAFLASGETSKLAFTISNISGEPCTALRINEAIPDDFEILYSEYEVSARQSVILNERLEPGSSISLKLFCRTNSPGQFVWRPTLLYADAAKNFKASRSQGAQHVTVESSSPEDLRLLIKEKQIIKKCVEDLLKVMAPAESEPESSEGNRLAEETYSLKRIIAEIDEKFTRAKYEMKEMRTELKRVESDLRALRAGPKVAEREEERINLKDERRWLVERLKRKRALLNEGDTRFLAPVLRAVGTPIRSSQSVLEFLRPTLATMVPTTTRHFSRMKGLTLEVFSLISDGESSATVHALRRRLGRSLSSRRFRNTSAELILQASHWYTLTRLRARRVVRDLSADIAYLGYEVGVSFKKRVVTKVSSIGRPVELSVVLQTATAQGASTRPGDQQT
jgi:hypothetical protein